MTVLGEKGPVFEECALDPTPPIRKLRDWGFVILKSGQSDVWKNQVLAATVPEPSSQANNSQNENGLAGGRGLSISQQLAFGIQLCSVLAFQAHD